MEKGDVAETEEVNTAIYPDEVYENRGESATIDKDTDKLKVSSEQYILMRYMRTGESQQQ